MLPQSTPDETWRPIPQWEDRYAISTLGRVWSIRAQKFMALHPQNSGYLMVVLKMGRKSHSKTVHSLVARTFMLPAPMSHEIDHVNGIKTDNRLINLEWVARGENHRRAYALGLRRYTPRNHARGERQGGAKLTAAQVREIRATPYFVGINQYFADKFGTTFSNISAVRLRKSWKHLP